MAHSVYRRWPYRLLHGALEQLTKQLSTYPLAVYASRQVSVARYSRAGHYPASGSYGPALGSGGALSTVKRTLAKEAKSEVGGIVDKGDATDANYSVWDEAIPTRISRGQRTSAPFNIPETEQFVPGSVVRGFEGLGVEPAAPSWVPALRHTQRHPHIDSEQLPVHEMPPLNSPEHPLAVDPEQERRDTMPSLRNRHDWAEQSPTTEDWVQNVHKELLNVPDPSNASRAHIYVAANALSVLKTQLDWRNAAAAASEDERKRVHDTVFEIAVAARTWPTYHMHEDLCALLSRLQELAISYCPEALAPLSEKLGAPQSDGSTSLLQSLISRACSIPMTFEDPASVRRLTLLLHETRIPCSSYFINFAAALQAIDGPTAPKPVSPVLAGGYTEPSFIQQRRKGEFERDPAIESLEAAAALGRDPSRAAAHVREQRQGSTPQYPLRVVTAALSTCYRVMQRHGPQDAGVTSAMHVMFRHLDRRWLEHMNSGSQDTVKGFTNFLVAHAKISVKPEPDVVAMMLKQCAGYVKECDPLGTTTIMTAVAQIAGPTNQDARTVFCIAHAQLLRNLRSYLSKTDYAAGVCCHASWAFGAMQFAPSLQLSEMFCSAVTVVLSSPGSTLTVQQICAFLWGIARVAKLQEASNRRSIGNRMVDTYGGKGSGWQRAPGPAMPDSAQMWQEVVMPALRAAQQPITEDLGRHQPHHARAVCMLLWAHAHLHRKPRHPLLRAMLAHAAACPQAYTAQGSCNLLWALHQIMPPSTAAYHSADAPEYMPVFHQHARLVADAVEKDLARADAKEAFGLLPTAAVTLHSLVARCAVADVRPPIDTVMNLLGHVEGCIQKCGRAYGSQSMHNEMCMVHQSVRVLELLGEVKQKELPGLRKMLQSVACKKQKIASPGKGKPGRTTLLERSVVASLFQLVKFNWFPQGTKIQEACEVDPLRTVDALITIPGCPSLVVEVDGPHHCIAYLGPHGPLNFNASNSWPDGTTQLRNWMLQKLGHKVATVMYYDVSPRSLKISDPSQQPHKSIVQTVAHTLRSAMGMESQGPSSSSSSRKQKRSSESLNTQRSKGGVKSVDDAGDSARQVSKGTSAIAANES